MDSGYQIPSYVFADVLRLGTLDQIKFFMENVPHVVRNPRDEMRLLLGGREGGNIEAVRYLLSKTAPSLFGDKSLALQARTPSVFELLMGQTQYSISDETMVDVVKRALMNREMDLLRYLLPRATHSSLCLSHLLFEGCKQLNTELASLALELGAPLTLKYMIMIFTDWVWTPFQRANFLRSLTLLSASPPLKSLKIHPKLIEYRDKVISHGFVLSFAEVEAHLRHRVLPDAELSSLILSLPPHMRLSSLSSALFANPSQYTLITFFKKIKSPFDQARLLEISLSTLSMARLMFLSDTQILPSSYALSLPSEEREDLVFQFLSSKIRTTKISPTGEEKKLKFKSAETKTIRRLVAALNRKFGFLFPTADQLATLSDEQRKVLKERRILPETTD